MMDNIVSRVSLLNKRLHVVEFSTDAESTSVERGVEKLLKLNWAAALCAVSLAALWAAAFALDALFIYLRFLAGHDM
jgi:hypothetical protein